VIALDIQKLLRARALVKCDAPSVITDSDGIIQRITAHNNGAEDCPTVTGTLNLDSQANFDTHGGPHFVAFDHETRRVAAANYFVQLTPFNLPGLHEAGDDRVCIARLTQTGRLVLDQGRTDRSAVRCDGPAGVVPLAQSRTSGCCQAARDGFHQRGRGPGPKPGSGVKGLQGRAMKRPTLILLGTVLLASVAAGHPDGRLLPARPTEREARKLPPGRTDWAFLFDREFSVRLGTRNIFRLHDLSALVSNRPKQHS